MAVDPQAFRVVEPKAMGPLKRMFGTVGIDGDGTEFEIDNVDPFLMCDHVDMLIDLSVPPFRPPFCAHPHAGNAVASILIEGEDMFAWDNVQGLEKEKLRAGGVYVVCSGRGCVHDEGQDPVVVERVIRKTTFGHSGENSSGSRFRFFQLWFDPGHVHLEGELPPASSTVLQPEAISTISAGAMKVRTLLGKYDEACGVDMPVTVLHCSLLPFTGHGTIKIPANAAGFVFGVARKAKVTAGSDELSIPEKQELLLPCRSEPYELRIEVDVDPDEAKADDAMELLVGFGRPIGKPYFKLLGYGGALVASSEQKVRALMKEYEQNPKTFGVPSGAAGADTSQYGLQIGYKNPMDGKGECQRDDTEAPAPEARFYLVEKGPYQPKGKGKGTPSESENKP